MYISQTALNASLTTYTRLQSQQHGADEDGHTSIGIVGMRSVAIHRMGPFAAGFGRKRNKQSDHVRLNALPPFSQPKR